MFHYLKISYGVVGSCHFKLIIEMIDIWKYMNKAAYKIERKSADILE